MGEKGEALVSAAQRVRVPLIVLAIVIVIVSALYAPAQNLYCAWRDQGVHEAQLEELNKTNEQYQDDINRLQTREGIEDEARKRGYVGAGETEVVVEGMPAESDDAAEDSAPEVPWYLAVADFIFMYDGGQS